MNPVTSMPNPGCPDIDCSCGGAVSDEKQIAAEVVERTGPSPLAELYKDPEFVRLENVGMIQEWRSAYKAASAERDQLRDALADRDLRLQEIKNEALLRGKGKPSGMMFTAPILLIIDALPAPAILRERERREKLEAEHARMQRAVDVAREALRHYGSPYFYGEICKLATAVAAALDGTAAQEGK